MKGVFVQTAKLIRKRTCILPAVILAAMRGHSRTCLNKLRAAPLLRALASLHIFAHRPAAAAPAVLRSLARCLFILTVIISHSQTCMNKLRIAPRSGAPAMLHTFVPRPAAAALAALRCSVLMCGRSQMSARPDMQAYPSLRPLARCLFILIFLSPAHPCAARRIVSQKQNIRFQNTRFCERLFVSQYIILHLHPQDIFHKIQSDIFYNSGSCFSYRSCPSYLHNHTLIILQNIRRRFFSSFFHI